MKRERSTPNYKMRIFLSLTYLALLLSIQSRAQTFTDSNLPIIIINTDSNGDIPDSPRILSTMKIISKGVGERNFVSDQSNPLALNYSGRIEIEVRGSSSQAIGKKQYSLTTLLSDNKSNNNISLLNLPKDNDWVLNGLAFDPSFIRDFISYELSRRIGEYAPRTKYCEVIINGDYKGLYVLQEKIKVDGSRVDISKIKPEDNNLPQLTGGYITKADKVSGSDISAWKMSSYIGTNDVNFIHEFPKPSDISAQQNQYIKSIFEKLDATAQAGNTSFSVGYPSVIDVPSFVNFMLINELSANVDAYQFSTFFHKDQNGKLRAGPIWDLNLTYGNDLFMWNLDRSKTDKWQFNNGDNIGPKFWRNLFDNVDYKCYLAKRWTELTQIGKPLNLTNITSLIDETVATISEATIREKTRWQSAGDHATQIIGIKNYLAARISWMNNNIGSSSNCSTVKTPPLVITKIMYHPATSTKFPDSNDQEFIEILNNGNEPIDLTGIYFSGTGFVYQFPAGSILPSQGVIQLANNGVTFEKLYGISAYSEFTRSLSNEGQKLTLADGFGNVIDEVEYSNKAPWPNADGNTNYLKLTNPNLDNALATNWIASTDAISTNVVGIEEADHKLLEVYPNPIENIVTIIATENINTLKVHDMKGMLLETNQVDSNSFVFNMNNYPNGVYLLTIATANKIVVRKVIKK